MLVYKDKLIKGENAVVSFEKVPKIPRSLQAKFYC
jgi:hypothetical protein